MAHGLDEDGNLNALIFCRDAIEGVGGYDDYHKYEKCASLERPEIGGAYWVLQCLCNPKCANADRIIASILERRNAAS